MTGIPLPEFPEHAGNSDTAVSDPGMQLHHATNGDIAFLRALYATTRVEELAATPWSPEMRAAFLDDQFALQHRHWVNCYPQADYLVVERQGRPVGRCYVDFARTAARDGDALLIDLSLLPAARGQGVGSALLTSLLRQCDLRGQALLLHVLHANPGALRLYRRFGFADEHDDGMRLRLRRAAMPAAVANTP